MKLQQTRRVGQAKVWQRSLIVIAALAASISMADAEQVPSPDPVAKPVNGSPLQTVDDADPGWIWNGMEDYSDPDLHGATGHAGGSGSYGAYTFSGVGVDIYGLSAPTAEVNGRIHKLGTIKISLDGKPSSEVIEKSTVTSYGFLIAKIDGLPDGNHVLQLAPDGGWGVVDYIVVHKSISAADKAALSTEAEQKPLIPAGYYRLTPRNAPDKCLDINDQIGQNGTPVVIYTPTAGHFQTWHIVPLGEEHYRVSPAGAPDQALSIALTTPALDDPPVVLWQYSGDARQQMLIRPVGDGFFRIGPASDDTETMDVFYNGTDNGSKTIGYKWAGGHNQQWWLSRVAAP